MKLPINNIPVRFPKWVFSWILLFFDSFMGFIVFYSVTEPRFTLSGDSSYNIELIYVTIQIFWCVLFYLNRLYLGEYTISRISELVRLVRIVGLVIGFYIISQSVGLIPELISPMIIMKYGFLLSFFTCCNRIFLRSIQKWLLEIGFGRENTVIVGANERGKKAVQFFRDHQTQGFNILGFIHFDGEPNDFVDGTKVLSHFNDIKNIIQKENISDVVLALNDSQRSSLFPIVQKLDPLPVTVKIIPDLYEVISGIARTQQISGLPLIDITLNLNTDYIRIYKPVFDFFFSLISIIGSIPLWIIISILIKVDSRGPILYKQKRVGKNNTIFNAIKFRSMVKEAEKQTGPMWAEKDDPRITIVGRFLRRFRLDELPQLLNVLKGHMSLVGPRPERPFFCGKIETGISVLYAKVKNSSWDNRLGTD